MKFIFKATRKNQPFLTNAVQLNAEEFQPFYNWMSDKLVIIGPTSKFSAVQQFADPTESEHAVSMMRKLNIGIDHFVKKRLDDPSSASLSNEFIEAARNNLLSEKNIIRFKDTILRIEQGEPVIEKLYSVHKSLHGEDVAFFLDEESEGTQRLLDLLPAFADLHDKQDKAFVVDELDRSLHPILQEWLIKFLLESCGKDARNQLIFTTHNVNLLNQKIFRRDELWGISKNNRQCSNLYSFRDFDGIRSDKYIMKIYLNGLIGAVPDFN